MRTVYFIFIVGILLCSACAEKDEQKKKLEQALERAKENRQELEKVLSHYENDSAKLAAACFLIENMPYHFTLGQGNTETHSQFDISTLDSSFLVNNIELAFTVWQKPWAQNVQFEDFCRYILPYRAQNEEV